MNLYRRHNPVICKSKDSVACTNKRHPCPIWVRGMAPDGHYVEKSLKSLTGGKTTRDWAVASDILKQWETNGKAPKVTTRTTIGQWKDSFLALAISNNLSSETLRKYRHLFKQLVAYCQDKGIRFVDEFDLETTTGFRLSWNDGALSTSKKLERLRGIMKFATEREWLTKNPALSLKPPKIKAKPTLPFTTAEMGKIMEAAQSDPRVHTFIAVMRSSGLRISDVTKLAVSSLDDNRLSLYQTKTGEFISILLDKTIADALRSVVPLNRNKDYFFWTGESTGPAAASLWRKRISDVFTDAKIVNGHTHRFRDTFAVALLENGNSIETVSRLLGHTSIKITERHYNPWVKSRQVALDAAVQGANGWLLELQNAKKG